MSSQQQQQQPQRRHLLYDAQVATDESHKDLCNLVNAHKKQITLLRAEHEKIEKGHVDLDRREQDLVKQNSHNDGTIEIDDDDLVEINAGGLPMTVTRGILTQIKGTPLEALFSGRWENKLLRDKEGRIFLDVNPSFFEKIVEYLNELKITPPDGPLPDLPRVDQENQLYLDQLMTTFGIVNETPRLELDTTTIDDEKHIQALNQFLSEDEINGELELLYRGSRDGFQAADFHSRCDNKGPTITIIKDVGGYLFGGFVNASWGTNDRGYTSCDKAFLFTLHCQSGLEPTKMRIRSDRTSNAISSDHYYGPIFGGGHDIFVYNNCNTNNSSYVQFSSYELPSGQDRKTFLTGSTSFQVSEIEVFKVTDSKKRSKLSSPTFDISNDASQADSSSSEPWQSAIFDEFPERFKDSLIKEQAALLLAKYDLQKRQLALDKEEAFIDYFASGDTKDVITFNVRGRVTETKRSVLGIFNDSVLAKQFCDPLWANAKDSGNGESNGVKDWDSTDVSSWIDTINGLSTEVTKVLKEQVLNGEELLALEREELKEMGITRPASVGLIMKKIRELREHNIDDGATVIDHSNYCFEKMLDHLRFVTLTKAQGDPSTPSAPIIKDHESKSFKEFVEYYFPNDTASFISLG